MTSFIIPLLYCFKRSLVSIVLLCGTEYNLPLIISPTFMISFWYIVGPFSFFLFLYLLVFEPRSIRCQFTYQTWIMMKMFLSAVATGLFCLATLSVLPWTKNAFENARIEYLGCLTTKGVLMASIGGVLLGVGMALSGAVSLRSLIFRP